MKKVLILMFLFLGANNLFAGGTAKNYEILAVWSSDQKAFGWESIKVHQLSTNLDHGGAVAVAVVLDGLPSQTFTVKYGGKEWILYYSTPVNFTKNNIVLAWGYGFYDNNFDKGKVEVWATPSFKLEQVEHLYIR